MAELAQIRNYKLKIIFLLHFLFIALSSMGYWSSSAYLFYNSILIVLLIWSLYHDENHEPIQLAIAVNGSSILLDILLLVMGFPTNGDARNKFSAAMAILHLLIRPFSTFFLIKLLEERSGSMGSLTGLFQGGQGSRSETYEDLDRPSAPRNPGVSGGYDFSTAQQI
ncbi:type-1 angiotensin II receptor-associated protein-like [Diorhabda carinulata]|uniref:type-1 angiotensin II receptor-associated protein-like n=1 Tax=Diorhabda carinulata TaxID=1163345 RepID=UPI0025A2511E|nr:type-1 angiotensin II receptor-associated protein-like [Diorhabda carinulata]